MICVVVPVRNGAETLPACLQALTRQTLPCRVIVVDDGSTDATAEVARQHGVECISIAPSGPAAARNRGVEAASGPVVLFTDADCVPAPDWATQLSAPFADPEIAGAKGVYRTHQREPAARFVQCEYQSKYDRMAALPQIDFIDTYSAAYRRDVFLENGGFETAFTTASVEDQEFSFRLAGKGYKMVFVPSAVVYHTHDRTITEYARRKFNIGYWKAFLLRWLPERTGGDSHTPKSLPFQIVALALGLLLGLAGVWIAPARWLATLLGLAFYGSAWRLLHSLWLHDRPVLLVAPLMLPVRALALGLGLAVGLLDFDRRASPRRPVLSLFQRAAKRVLDIIGSSLALLCSLPVLLVAGVAIKLDSPGPVFFVHPRVGQNGQVFQMVKLRSMTDGAAARFDEMAAANPLDGPAVKLPKDPRVTRVGRWLRRWSLDELPQFWNVLRGEMSLVGPRPEEPHVVEKYNDWHRQRLAIKPGVTGPMQVNGRGNLSLDERVHLELAYIAQYSLWKDIVILARTPGVVISGEGAY